MGLVLFRLVDIGLREMFSYPHCMYLEPTCESDFFSSYL